jgi:hypothetical protein
MRQKEMLTPDSLYSLLPSGTFNIEFVFNQIMDYSPHQRFPRPRYDLYNMLNSWYVLLRKKRIVIVKQGIATKECQKSG